MANFHRQNEGVGESGGWLVILNKSLAESELHHLLSSQKYRVRGESQCVLNKINLCHQFTLISARGSSFTLCMPSNSMNE